MPYFVDARDICPRRVNASVYGHNGTWSEIRCNRIRKWWTICDLCSYGVVGKKCLDCSIKRERHRADSYHPSHT